MMMPKNYIDFSKTLDSDISKEAWPQELKSLWFDANGDWETSHAIAQDLHNDIGSWIHAYLHRKEGDKFNAGYWYRRANKPFPSYSLEEEHKIIVEFILSV